MSVSPLADLIRESQELFEQTHGVRLSYAAIATRSGGRIVRNWVRQIATRPIKALPGPEVIKGLSLGLGIPESVVLERALASAGYTTPVDWHSSPHVAQVDYAATAQSADVPEAARERVIAADVTTWGGASRPTDVDELRKRIEDKLSPEDAAELAAYLDEHLAAHDDNRADNDESVSEHS